MKTFSTPADIPADITGTLITVQTPRGGGEAVIGVHGCRDDVVAWIDPDLGDDGRQRCEDEAIDYVAARRGITNIDEVRAAALDGDDDALDALRRDEEVKTRYAATMLDYIDQSRTTRIAVLPEGCGMQDFTACRWIPDYTGQRFRLVEVNEDGSHGRALHTLHWGEDDDGGRVWYVDSENDQHDDPRAAIDTHIVFDHHGMLTAPLDYTHINAMTREDQIERGGGALSAVELAAFAATPFRYADDDLIARLTHRIAIVRDELLSQVEYDNLIYGFPPIELKLASVIATATAIAEQYMGVTRGQPPVALLTRLVLWVHVQLQPEEKGESAAGEGDPDEVPESGGGDTATGAAATAGEAS